VVIDGYQASSAEFELGVGPGEGRPLGALALAFPVASAALGIASDIVSIW
jgi:hypothetical protein